MKPSTDHEVMCILGRLYQVEYAMEAINHAGIAIGVLGSDGVVLAAEKKIASKLLDNVKGSEKMLDNFFESLDTWV